jgi:hypothetical protein
MAKLAEVRRLLINRTDKVTDIDEINKVVFFATLEGHRYALDFSGEASYIELTHPDLYDYEEMEPN